ncbi:hypothetical protein ACLOJK_024353 [Asimina triloba]
MHHRSTEIRCSIFPKEHPWPPTTSDETTKQFPSILISSGQRSPLKEIPSALQQANSSGSHEEMINSPSSSPLNRSNPVDLGHDPPIIAPVVKSAAEGNHPNMNQQARPKNQTQIIQATSSWTQPSPSPTTISIIASVLIFMGESSKQRRKGLT